MTALLSVLQTSSSSGFSLGRDVKEEELLTRRVGVLKGGIWGGGWGAELCLGALFGAALDRIACPVARPTFASQLAMLMTPPC